MAHAIRIRSDYDSDILRRLARDSRDPKQVRRLLALAAIYDGASRTEAARIGGVGLQVLRDWVVRFNAGGPTRLIDHKAPGKAHSLNDEQRLSLARAVESEPNPYLGGVRRWRLRDLVQFMKDQFGVTVSETTIGRELHAMGFQNLQSAHGYFDQFLSQTETLQGSGVWVKRQR